MAKPDAVERGLIGEVVARLERKGLRLVAAQHRMVDEALAAAHYAEHEGKPFYGELISFITRSPVFAMVVEGPADNTFSLVRMLVGATKVDDALPGTIRGDELEALALDASDDLSDQTALHRVGLGHDEGPVHGCGG